MNENLEIPEAVKEFWPRLRQLVERETLQLIKEERERTAEAPDYQMLGLMSVGISKLMDRMDVAMTPSVSTETAKAARGVARLKTVALQTNTP